MPEFHVVSDYSPSGDQPEAIEALSAGIENGLNEQTLLGVTGSGKTYTMAKVIERIQRPTLVLAHNKTLAAQLCSEFREFFPDNAVEYFVSYYDYYQPEAYVPSTDTYIEKDASTNEEIDRLRLSATASLLERRDVVVVASVSCIYGLGEPEDFEKMMVPVRVGLEIPRDELIKRLIEIRYERNDIAFERNVIRVRGDTVEVWPAYYKDSAIRIEFFGDEIDRVSEINTVTGEVIRRLTNIPIFPASHYITPKEKLQRAVKEIRRECDERVAYFKSQDKLLEAQRIEQRGIFRAFFALCGVDDRNARQVNVRVILCDLFGVAKKNDFCDPLFRRIRSRFDDARILAFTQNDGLVQRGRFLFDLPHHGPLVYAPFNRVVDFVDLLLQLIEKACHTTLPQSLYFFFFFRYNTIRNDSVRATRGTHTSLYNNQSEK